MAKSNKTKYSLLGLLSREPMSGYDIKKFIEQSISYFWNESYGQIYPILKQLVSEGLATKELERQEGRPDRKVYTITERGREELRQWLREPPDHPPPRDELLLKLFFGVLNPPSYSVAHLQEERDRVKEVLGYCRHVEQDLMTRPEPMPSRPYVLSTVRLGLHAMEARLTWCDETIAALEALEAEPEGGQGGGGGEGAAAAGEGGGDT